MKKAKPLLLGGSVKPGFEDVLHTFESNIKDGTEKGGSFAAYYHGQLVANVWGGYSDFDCRRPWKEDTLSTFFSSTKAIASAVIAHLVDRGLLSYKDKVSKHWPDFAQNGKENVTVEQLITNQAGLITVAELYWLAELRDDPVGLAKKLARQKPYWKPGEKFGYHPVTFGLYLDQIVRHVDKKGRNLAQYFQEEMAEPFDIEFYIGLPKSLFHKATRVLLSRRPDTEEMLQKFRGELELIMEVSKNPQDFKSTLKINDPDNRELPCPSTHGHGTAASMAKFFSILANGGTLEGRRLMSEEAVRQIAVPRVEGYDCSFGIDSRWGYGVQLFTVIEGNKPEYHILGHGGYGGQYAGADLEHRVSFAYTTSFLDPFSSYDASGDQRMKSMFESLYRCIERIEHIIVPRQTFYFYSEYKKYLEDKSKDKSKL